VRRKLFIMLSILRAALMQELLPLLQGADTLLRYFSRTLSYSSNLQENPHGYQ